MKSPTTRSFELKSYQPSETAILNAVRSCLRLYGWFVIRIQQGLGCHKGVSDLVATKAGRTVWIEVKVPKGRLSPYQEKFWDDINRAGGEYLVMRSAEDAIKFCKGES